MNLIGANASIGKNFSIGNFCIIEDGVIIGDNVTVKSHIELREGTVIGNNCYIDSYVRSSGRNRIDNNVTIRFGATIARGVWIDDEVFIAPNVMTIYEKGKNIYIGKRSKIFTAAVINAGVAIIKDTIIGANAYVNKDCRHSGVYVGVPARRL